MLSLLVRGDITFPFENLQHSDSEQLFYHQLVGDTCQTNTLYPLMYFHPSKNKHGFRQHESDSAFSIVSSFLPSNHLDPEQPHCLTHAH